MALRIILDRVVLWRSTTKSYPMVSISNPIRFNAIYFALISTACILLIWGCPSNRDAYLDRVIKSIEAL